VRPAQRKPRERLPYGEHSKRWWTWERATGDWGGARSWLDEHGLTLEATYTADYWVNTHGGLDTSGTSTYQALVDVSLTIDTERIGLWQGGTVFIDFQNMHGRSISDNYVGDLQLLDNNDSPARTQVSEYWYRQSLFGGKLAFKIGKMDANTDFAYVDYGLAFIHSSPAFPPNIPLPTYPDPTLGAALFIEPAEWFFVNAGIYDANGKGSRWDFESAFHGPDDSFTIVEMGLRPTFELGKQKLPGVYRLGGWYHSAAWLVFPARMDGIEEEPRRPETRRGNCGVYVLCNQLLYREKPDDEQDEQGLGAFFQFSWADSRLNEISQYYGAGFECVGLFPTRDRDVTGIGMFYANISHRLRSTDDLDPEVAFELFHALRLTPFAVVKPDLQYILNPGGNGRDALVAGVRVEISL
jgi:porin